MKSKFASVYLYLFGFDGFLGLFRGLTTLLGLEISLVFSFKLFSGVFTFGIIVCSVIQIAIGFAQRMKWSARIIGIYVLFYSFLSMIIGLIFGLITALEGIGPLEAENLILRTTFMNVYIMIIGIIQIILFLWALKDLSKGHYLNKK